MEIKYLKSFNNKVGFYIEFLLNKNKYSVLLKKLESTKKDYWTATFFHEFSDHCPSCDKKGYYDEKTNTYTNMNLACIGFDKIDVFILEKLEPMSKTSFLINAHLEFSDVIDSIKERKNMFLI